ncbi:MAG: hypothetical protein IT518_22920 [Burkholderiales bacterium]|nr:hypothetical protein [Burkholderiales bacterium]
MRLRTRGRLNLKHQSRALDDRLRGTPFDRALRDARRAGQRDFVFGWNRGLGDVALGLVPLFARIRATDPGSRVTVFTRAELAETFALTDADAVHVVPGLARGAPLDLAAAAREARVALPANAVVFADPDPTRWLDGQRHLHPPALRWDARWNALADARVPAEGIVIGAHVSSETAQHYGYVKDWPASSWRLLFARFAAASGVNWVLFGHEPDPAFAQDNVIDLRGRTSFLALLATIRNRCRILIAPDSGVLTAAYYLAGDFPLDVVSLWSDPRQGVLKQGCASPNPRLRHVPLRGPAEDVRNLTVDEVSKAVAAALALLRHAPAH